MISDPLFACRAKIARAREELQLLDKDIAGFIANFREGDAYTVVPERDPDTREEVHRIRLAEPVPLVRWGIATGIIVHLSRSALDNLIDLLTVRYTGHRLPRTEFPVFWDRDKYFEVRKDGTPAPQSGANKVSGVDPAAAKRIEELQPYNHPAGYRENLLWALNEFWNMDKHRVPPVVATGAFADRMRLTRTRTPETMSILLRRPMLEDKAEIARFAPDPDPKAPYMKVDLDLSPEIGFGDGPAEGRQIAPTLVALVGVAEEILGIFAPYMNPTATAAHDDTAVERRP